MKVQCPNCKRKSFETTEKFNPDKTPNGGMVKCLLPYQIDWLCVSTTLAAEMTCPECLAPLVHNGMLCVLYPTKDAGGFFKTDDATVNSDLPTGDKSQIEEQEAPDDLASDVPEEPKTVVGETAFVCEVCGKTCKTALALSGHKRSHFRNGK